jgi:predicted alpha/beta-fold hydrolase
MMAMAQKGFARGFNVVRMNLRNCGGTEHLTPTLYHGGLSEDLRAIVTELIERDHLERLLLIGFSLGGNMVLKLAAEYAYDFPPQVLGMCAISPSVDLSASSDLISLRSNWIYHQDFVRRLKRRIKLKQQLYPQLYDTSQLRLVRTLRDFDSSYTALAHGFKDVDDYYSRASSVTLLDRIELPTLIIHAEDDPFIPYAPLTTSAAVSNPAILLIGTKHGGHVAFLSANQRNLRNTTEGTDENLLEDRFWAENRALDFCRLALNE